MLDRVWRPAAALAGFALIAGLAFSGTAQAESIQKQCSTKYRAAKASNSLNGESWNQFYKQCAADLRGGGSAAAPAAAPATTSAPPPATATQAAPAPEKRHWWHRRSTESGAASAPPPVATGNVIFPSGISPQYRNLSAGKGRFKTCVDQYHANKANGGNGGLKWIEKGGGYYSECNRHLKGM